MTSRKVAAITPRNALPQEFYDRSVQQVARDLLGKLIIRQSESGTCIGRIVETEAYLAEGDTASHSYRGRTKKNSAMFGPPGFAYVYSIHARYCMNAVTESRCTPSAVLIRAIEPLHGIELMTERRRTDKLVDLCRGPARLCEALSIDRQFDGWNMTDASRLWIADDGHQLNASNDVSISVRIGVTSQKESLLRFFIDGSPFVSGPKKLHRVKPQVGR